MLYDYNEDDFLISTVSNPEDLQDFENDSKSEIEKLNISDNFYKERLIKLGVYKRIAGARLEAEGDVMDKKLQYYTREWDKFLTMYKTSNASVQNSVSSVPIYRG